MKLSFGKLCECQLFPDVNVERNDNNYAIGIENHKIHVHREREREREAKQQQQKTLIDVFIYLLCAFVDLFV